MLQPQEPQEHLGGHATIEFLLNNFKYINYFKDNLHGPINRSYLDKLLYKHEHKPQIIKELVKYRLFINNPYEINFDLCMRNVI